MITIKEVDDSVQDGFSLEIKPAGWIVMVDEKGEQRPFRVNSINFRFELTSDTIYQFPNPRSWSIRGNVAKKDGRGWFAREEWMWSHRHINGKALEFPDLPQVIQDTVYERMVAALDAQQKAFANSLAGLTKNRKFIPPGYQSMHQPQVSHVNLSVQEEDEEDSPLPFLPSVAMTAPKVAWEEQDVSKWKVAVKEINHVPEPESNEETQVSA